MDTIEEICNFIFRLENKYDLLEYDVDGVKPWQAHRMSIYYSLAQKAGILSTPQRKDTLFTWTSALLSILKHSVLHSPFFLNNADVVVVPHPRSKWVNGRYIDIYTHYLVEEERQKGNTVVELEGHYGGRHLRDPWNYKGSLDVVQLLGNLAAIGKTGKCDPRFNIFDEVASDIEAVTGIRLPLREDMAKVKAKLSMYISLFTRILKTINPEVVYLTVAYSNAAITVAAKRLGIRTVEVQHGTFSRFHLGYSYPPRPGRIDYFPDEFLVWNEYWKSVIELPIPRDSITVYPFKYLEQRKTAYEGIVREKDSVVVLSQGALGGVLAERILANFDKFKKMKIRYKLHPGEYDRWRSYEALSQLASYSNVEVLCECDLYELFARSEFQVGVFSTALYEGVEFGCKTILVNLPGIEYMKDFIDLHERTPGTYPVTLIN